MVEFKYKLLIRLYIFVAAERLHHMRQIFFIFVFSLLSYLSFGQSEPIQLGKGSSDCLGALMLNDTIVGPVFSPSGFGSKLEISGYELGDPYYIEREHNSVWYKFQVPYDAVFTFDIIPEVAEDDFDFLMFQYDGPNFCKDVAIGTKIPIRTNISRKNTYLGGRTGLIEGSIDEYVPSGPGSSYSKPLKVKKGELYYLLVDNPFRENEGHTVVLHYREINKSLPSKPIVENVYEVPYRKLVIDVKDSRTGERIASDITVEGLPDSVQFRFPSISHVELDVVSYRTYNINIVKKGYLLATKTFVPKNDSSYTVGFDLKEMEIGDRINLDNIQFETDDTKILDKSLPAFVQLTEFMQVNPSMTVEIQGHVNGEGKKNKKKFIKLSEARARAIGEKLVESGVNPKRISYKGFGNSKMIYPTPINNRQSEANRRVEIEITSL
jgi:outer membrane protein OmpA-like peptidoglycan-associated protein